MSAIEIPNEFREAWQLARRHPRFDNDSKLCDALVWAVAGWMRSEWQHEHSQGNLDKLEKYHYCEKCGMRCEAFQDWDPRHNYTWKQWLDAAREYLESMK